MRRSAWSRLSSREIEIGPGAAIPAHCRACCSLKSSSDMARLPHDCLLKETSRGSVYSEDLPPPTLSAFANRPFCDGHHIGLTTFAAGTIGNVLERYDFAIYGYFAVPIGRHFFPHEDAIAQ